MQAAKNTIAGFLRRHLSARFAPSDSLPLLDWNPRMRDVCHEAPEQLRKVFVAGGYNSSLFFSHRVRWLPKCGPDGLKLASRMCGVLEPGLVWQIVLYATSPAIDEFPPEIFFDSDIAWHQQHFNRTGQVASVNLAARDNTLFTMAHQSDLVQRISRKRQLKTRVEKVFKGWNHLLLNAVGCFASECGFAEIRVPTSRFAMKHTDGARTVKPELFERVYDRSVHARFGVTETGDWWSICVAKNRTAIIPLRRKQGRFDRGKTVCVCHDIERGQGHRDIDPEFAQRAEAESPAALDRMLATERRAGIRATYSVVGSFIDEVRGKIEKDGHCLAFHSYDHDRSREQLGACRKVDYRIKGYRAPQSVLNDELRGDRLTWHNFEWLASSASSFGFDIPRLKNRLVKIPILLDDFSLHTGQLTYAEWRRRALDAIQNRDFVALGLHDCYAGHWVEHYERLLEDIKALAQPRTLDEVAADLYVAAGE